MIGSLSYPRERLKWLGRGGPVKSRVLVEGLPPALSGRLEWLGALLVSHKVLLTRLGTLRWRRLDGRSMPVLARAGARPVRLWQWHEPE